MIDIKGYEGLYAITSCGKVWSHKKNKFLKPEKTKNGYLRVDLYKGGEYRHFLIHRLVAEAYIPNENNLPTVNHKSEDKTQNYTNNLEWATYSENINYGERNKKVAKALAKPVCCVELDRIFESVHNAAKTLGLNQANITRCCLGEKWYKTCGGYHWKYM